MIRHANLYVFRIAARREHSAADPSNCLLAGFEPTIRSADAALLAGLSQRTDDEAALRPRYILAKVKLDR